ncbi:MAG: alpha/beta hydrolase-fold protein [Bacteroidota bacterium]
MNRMVFSLLFLLLHLFTTNCLGQQLVVDSKILNTKTEVEILPLGNADDIKSALYFTDGEKLLGAGVAKRLHTLFKAGKIPPAYLVFVSAIDLNDSIDKRNTYFFCNPDYLDFFENELLPHVEKTIGKAFTPDERGLVGISFGGLNAAWFSAKSTSFTKYALLSPVTYPCKKVIQEITFSRNDGLKLFISTGKNDAEHYVEELVKIYQTKEYEIHSERTQGGHDFKNWASQFELMLNFLFG